MQLSAFKPKVRKSTSAVIRANTHRIQRMSTMALYATNVNRQSGLGGLKVQNRIKSKPYCLQKRENGSGPIRIGTHLELSEDIYSMLFISTMDYKYVYYHMEVAIKDASD